MAPRRPHLSDVLHLPRLPGITGCPPSGPGSVGSRSVTTVAAEEQPAAAGLEAETVEHIWEGALDLYRSGVHPGLQLCLRREGRVVLDRAIGHARGNGPADSEDTPKVPMTTETPACIFSASKAVTAMVIHLLDERAPAPHRRSRQRVHPRVRPERQGGDDHRPRAGASRRRRLHAQGGSRPRLAQRLGPDRQADLRGEAERPARAACSPTTPSRAGSSSARSSGGSPGRPSATCWPRRSSTRSASGG